MLIEEHNDKCNDSNDGSNKDDDERNRQVVMSGFEDETAQMSLQPSKTF